MLIAEKTETTVCETATHGFECENSLVSISNMSSSELLRFGLSAKYRLSHAPAPNDPELTDLTAQLNEARLEWNRRHPHLPLRDSF
jgi:hypothetical protein